MSKIKNIKSTPSPNISSGDIGFDNFVQNAFSSSNKNQKPLMDRAKKFEEKHCDLITKATNQTLKRLSENGFGTHTKIFPEVDQEQEHS